MKRLFTILLVLLICFGMVGCSQNESDTSNDDPNQTNETNHLEGKENLNILLYCAFSLSGYSNHVNIYNYLTSDEFKKDGQHNRVGIDENVL